MLINVIRSLIAAIRRSYLHLFSSGPFFYFLLHLNVSRLTLTLISGANIPIGRKSRHVRASWFLLWFPTSWIKRLDQQNLQHVTYGVRKENSRSASVLHLRIHSQPWKKDYVIGHSSKYGSTFVKGLLVWIEYFLDVVDPMSFPSTFFRLWIFFKLYLADNLIH